MKRFILYSLILALIIPSTVKAKYRLRGRQAEREKIIANICIENWDRYGVLPSVCLAQAMEESTMGEYCRGFNYWGINSGRGYNYSSVEEGTFAYLRVINKDYYKKARFQKSYRTQLKYIMQGGYCNPPYTDKACWIIEHYNFDKYDQKLFKKLQKRKEREELEKLRSQQFTLGYSKDCPEHCCIISDKLIKKGTVTTVIDDEIMRIYDVQTADIPTDIVYISGWHQNSSKKIKLVFNEEAKG